MPTFNIADLVPDLSIGMTEDGELNFEKSNTPETKDGEGNDGKPASAEGTAAKADGDGKSGTDKLPGDAQSPAGDKTVDWEKRYKDLQADHTRSKQELSETRSTLSEFRGELNALKDLAVGKQTPSTDQTEEDLLDALADRERAPQVLQQLIEKGISKAMESTPEARIQREFNDAATKFTDFKDQLPVIKRLSSELSGLNVNFSFEQLYALSKLIPKADAANPPKIEAAAGKAQADGMNKEEADALKAKAASLATESGVAASPESKPRVNSVKAALNAALEELGYA